jgi:hypothetical protein
MIIFHHATADLYVKKYEKKRKHEKIDIAAFVKKPRETPHAFGMLNKFITNTKLKRIGYLCPVLF